MDFPLRPYQKNAVTNTVTALKRGVNKQILSMPTGVGKTICAGAMIDAIPMDRVVMQVHRDELVLQTIDKWLGLDPNLDIGIIKGERDELDHKVLIISAQTTARKNRLQRVVDSLRNNSVLFLDDECHHSASTTRRRTIETINPDVLIGLTATAFRSDKKSLAAIYQEVTTNIPIHEMISEGWIVEPIGMRIDIDADLDTVCTIAGDLSSGELSDVMNTTHINKIVVDTWKQYGQGRKTIAFCVDVQHAQDLCSMFNSNNVKADYIVGTTKSEDREVIYNRFKNGDLQVLVNVGVLGEGYDEPVASCILICRPTKSLTCYVQQVGRGLRLYPNKENCLVIDYVGNTFKHNLITFPTWAGVEALGEESIDNPVTRIGESSRKSCSTVSMSSIINEIHGARTKKVSAVDIMKGGNFVWNQAEGGWMINTRQGVYNSNKHWWSRWF